jgi:hypothetical protein
MANTWTCGVGNKLRILLCKNSMQEVNPTHADRQFTTHLAYSLCFIVAQFLGYKEIHTDSSYPTGK